METLEIEKVETLTPPEIPTIETHYDVVKRAREAAAEELLANQNRQIKGEERDAQGNVCFIGLLGN